ncbi:MAG: hypothetical protein WKG07_14260 [Hymenobacter sp.]
MTAVRAARRTKYGFVRECRAGSERRSGRVRPLQLQRWAQRNLGLHRN